MICRPCGVGEAALRPKENMIDVSNGEEALSGGVSVNVPMPREREYGMRNPRKLQDPRLPSRKEVDDHHLAAHLPYRSWCAFCVMGKGKAAPHYKQTREDGLPEIHLDYCFMSTEGKPLATILVAKEKLTKMMLATVVPLKGGSVEFPTKRILAFLKEIGLESADVVLKSDQESAILDLLKIVASRRAATSKLELAVSGDTDCGVQAASSTDGATRSIIEASPVGSSGSNGFIERGIQDVEGQARTIKVAFESHVGVEVPSDHNLVPWIVEFAAVSINRGQVSSDGKTAYERLKAKPASLCGLEFGERVLWRSNVPARDRRNKMDSEWKHGIFIGQRTLSGEYIVGTADGTFRPRTIHRVPVEKRWIDNLTFVSGLPWRLNKDHNGDAEVFLDENPPDPSLQPATCRLPPTMVEEPVTTVRQFYVKATDVDPSSGGLGFMPGCPGCKAIINGKKSVAHSETCRLRVMEQASSKPSVAARIKVTRARDTEYHAKRLEAEEEKKKKEGSTDVTGDSTMQDNGEAGRSTAQVGGSSGSSSSAPVATESRKRAADDQDIPVVPDQVIVGPAFSPPRAEKRSAADEPDDDYQTAQESKQQRIGDSPMNMIDVAVEEMEMNSLSIKAGSQQVRMTTCEEPIHLAYLEDAQASLLAEAISCTNVGAVRAQLDEEVRHCMMNVLCGSLGVQSGHPSSEVESIFEPGSRMGREDDTDKDYWQYDASKAIWTRHIVVPRVELFHPSEGAVDDQSPVGPKLANLMSRRWTIPDGVAPVRDDWRRVEDSSTTWLEADGSPLEWVGTCVFYERWAAASDDEEDDGRLLTEMQNMESRSRGRGGQTIAEVAALPGDLVFQDIPERNTVDDLSGKPLEVIQVTAAKHEEITEMYRRKVWLEREVSECLRETGKPPIPVRWVVTNKGDELHPNVRCRLVAKHLVAKYGGKDAEDLFAAMPPFELIKSLFVKAVQRNNWKKVVRKVMFIDVSKAHLYAPVGGDTKAYVELPPECGKPGVCGLLQFWLYGMRPASHGWQDEYTKQLELIGFRRGEASPCCFYREKDDISCVVHGDDFTFEGSPEALLEIAAALKKVWLVKVRAVLGPEASDDKEVSILNRVVRWCDDCLLYEADPRHVEKLLRDAGLEDCKSLSTPGVKSTTASVVLDDGVVPSGDGVQPDPGPRKLDREEMRVYRSAVARCNYLAADRFEIAFTTKELCRSMSCPTEEDMVAVRRLCRFLRGLPRMVQRIEFGNYVPSVIRAFVDSDWAGCRRTRKSTSGGVLYLGDTPVRGWSSNQAVIALSSGEAEYYAALKGASAALGYQSMLRDIGIRVSVTLFTDSSAARGIIHRAGLGKLRHLETGYLWLQAAVANKRLQVRKVKGTENPADLFTKYLAAGDMWKHLETLNVSPEEGRSNAVPMI